jgi:hypothetical protein
LSNKKALFYNIVEYYRGVGETPFDIIPLSFHIQDGVTDPEFGRFLEVYNDIARTASDIEKINK